MENTLYYTLSTIAQSLAGALALLGAFVLYRLQTIEHELEQCMNVIADSWYEDDTFKQLFARGDVRGFFAEVADRLSKPMTVGWSHRQESRYLLARRLIIVRATILKSVRPVLWFPASVMCGAVLGLSCVTLIACRPLAAIGTLTIGVVAFAISIVLFVRFIGRLLNGAGA